MVGFIFGGNTGISSPQELERRRAIADMLASGASRAPKDAGEGLTAIGQALAFRLMDRRNRRDAEAGRAEGNKAFANLFSMFGGGQPDTQAPEMAGGTAVSPTPSPQPASSSPPMDYPSQRVAQAFGDAPSGAGGEIETYIRDAAKARGIDPDVAVAVAKSEGGLKDPYRQSDIVKNGVREQSYGPFQLYMGGGLGNKALEIGVDPRKDWKRGVDFALDQAAKGGWGPWYGAKKIGVTGMHGIGQRPAPQPSPDGNWQPGQPMPTMPLGPGAAPQAPEMAGAPVQVAQAGGGFPAPPQPPQGGQNGNRLQMLMQAAQNPWLSADQKAMVNMMLQQEMAKSDPMQQLQMEKMRMEVDAMRNPAPQYDFITGRDGSIFRTDKSGGMQQVYGGKPDKPTDVQEYEYARGQGFEGSFADWQLSQKRAGASQVNIDQRAEGAFDKKLAEGQAESLNAMATEGMNARADLGVITELESLLGQNGGTTSGIAGWLAQRGIGGEGMSDLQAAQALINRLVPTQRQPGSGSMSDRDVELFTRSLPSLWNTPGGNQKILGVMRGLAQYKQAQGDIAARVLSGEMSRQEATAALRALPNPLAQSGKGSRIERNGYIIEQVD